ncbi:MAG: ARPP-1 family domain-containing protein [Candidatus Hodarchaeales archaeon]|jgi:hypothetical protein
MTLKEIIADLGSFYTISDPFSYEKFTIYPLIGSELSTPIISILESEESGIGWIEETDSVQVLHAINKGNVPILLPYLHQVEGGKQDRTIFEPILVPEGRFESNPVNIPARCIERSRWRYSTSQGETTSKKFKSSKTRMASQMSYSSARYQEQEVVWNNVAAAGVAMDLEMDEAPTSSYREMNVKAFEKKDDLKELKENLMAATKVEGQIGLVCYYDDKILGLEAYGSPKLWKDFSEEVLKGFLIDRYFLQKVEAKEEEKKSETGIKELLITEFKDVKLSKEKTAGTGDLFKFRDDKWEGITILFDGLPIHLYAVKEQVRLEQAPRTMSNINQSYESGEQMQRIITPVMNRLDPREYEQREE